MKLIGRFFIVLFIATAISGSALPVADSGPSNPCLFIPEIDRGQPAAANDYEPESCVT